MYCRKICSIDRLSSQGHHWKWCSQDRRRPRTLKGRFQPYTRSIYSCTRWPHQRYWPSLFSLFDLSSICTYSWGGKRIRNPPQYWQTADQGSITAWREPHTCSCNYDSFQEQHYLLSKKYCCTPLGSPGMFRVVLWFGLIQLLLLVWQPSENRRLSEFRARCSQFWLYLPRMSDLLPPTGKWLWALRLLSEVFQFWRKAPSSPRRSLRHIPRLKPAD